MFWHVLNDHVYIVQVFSLFNIPLNIFLAVWLTVWLFAKWQKKIDYEHRGGPTEGVTDALDPDQQDFDD